MMMGPDGKPLKVVQIERAGDEAWAGVAALDKGEQPTSLGKTLTLVGGDITALLVFAAIGRVNHGEVLDSETLLTALPFIVGWFTSAGLLGGFGAEAQGGDTKSAALVAAKCWALGTPLALGLRWLSKGYAPPLPFAIVSLVVTAVLLVGWRSALSAATPKVSAPLSKAGQMALRKDKTGNPLEFLELLFSLTKRW